jgi:hypothetical protein
VILRAFTVLDRVHPLLFLAGFAVASVGLRYVETVLRRRDSSRRGLR